MATQTLPQSAPKYEFLAVLGLDASRQNDKHLYCEMKVTYPGISLVFQCSGSG